MKVGPAYRAGPTLFGASFQLESLDPMVSKSAFFSALLVLWLGTGVTSMASPLDKEAAIYGKISGRVVDAATGDPLPGVNVVIDGTTQGTATDLDGEYVIIRIRPGRYALRAQFIGFQTQVIENVEVIIDQTTRVDFRLGEEILEGEEIVVTAERPIVQVDRTTTTAVVGEEQLEALPVLGINDAINLQAGVVDGRFRGGRSGEVAYLINGIPINNAFNNQASFEIEQNMVSNLQVISGVFNSEYGQAQSGVVNIVTKDIPDSWSGNVLAYAGTMVSDRELEFMNRTVGPGNNLLASDFGSETYTYNELAPIRNLTDVQFSFGGPLLNEKLGLQVTTRWLDDNGNQFGRRLFSPADSSVGLNTGRDPSEWNIESNGDGDFVSMGTNQRLSINTGLTARLSGNTRFEYNLFWQDGKTTPYSHDAKYVPDGLNGGYYGSQTHIAALRYTVGTKSFGQLSYSLLRDKWDYYLFEDPTDPRYQWPQKRNLDGQNAFDVGGNDLFSDDQLTVTHTILTDFTSQVNKRHLVKGGLMSRLHRLKNRSFGIERSARTGNLPAVSPDRFADNELDVKPTEFAAYIQDKMEFTGLIVNAGLRFDYFNSNFDIPVEWRQAQDARIFDPASQDSISNRVKADPDMQISPRIGIAFPISSTGVMRFSAGLFFQIPALALLYTNPEYEVNPQSSSVQFGNPALEPERTLAFEVGLQQGLTDNIGLELTIFSKDVRNLTGQEIDRTPTGDQVVQWINRDFGTIRGFTFSMFDRPGGKVSWTFDYTLQFAEGTSSDPGEAFGRAQSGLEPILSLVRLNWDRRHVFNSTVTIKPIEGLSVTMVNRLRSGEPYTTVRGFVRSTRPNNADRPVQFWTDLRAYYAPPFIEQDVQLFLQVQNLWDRANQYAVWATTGSWDESLELEQFRATGAAVGGLNTLDEYYARPDWVSGPRQVSLGLQYSF
jgi:outer membrane receptor protein involved in Fe transport